jgi:MFS family permease
MPDKSPSDSAITSLESPLEESPHLAEKITPSEFNEQTNYVPAKIIITVRQIKLLALRCSYKQIFLACASVDLLALMDQTTLAAALTIVSRNLGAQSEDAWIAGAYFLTSTSFQLLYGRLSDIWSRKVLLVIGIGIFFLGSLASSLARTSLQLIIFRAFTGIGGGGLVTVAQMIVSDIVPLRERGKYQGILVSVAANEIISFPNHSIGFCSCSRQWHWTANWRCFSITKHRVMVQHTGD